MITIGDHILIPHRPDFSTRPRLRRQWRTGVDRSLTGREAAASVRGYAFREYRYTVLPYDAVEHSLLVDAIEAALRATKAAVPFWGRGTRLSVATTAGASLLTLERASHGITAGHYIILTHWDSAEHRTWEIASVASVSSATLFLGANLTLAWPAGTWAHPIMFGRLEVERETLRNNWRGHVPLKLIAQQPG
jgi:hypothetical protein